jgi:serine phosphatase RsbU (regulator of sigma subunit)
LQLQNMSRWKLWFFSAWWLFKSMMLKLTPARRIVFVIGIVSLIVSRVSVYSSGGLRIEVDISFLGICCVLFVLMLELKDKLIAKEELEAGRAVQKAFLPPASPEVPGWQFWLFCRSANDVGGDLVDFIRVSDDRCSVVLGDVAGKGLPAALFMVKLQATIRALVSEHRSLDDLVSRLNRIFCRDSSKNVFASVIYAECSPGGDAVRLINAGHLPPLKVTREGAVSLPKGCAAIGIFPDAEFEEQEVPLDRSEYLCLYSDGVTEAQDREGRMFGEERLREALAAGKDRPLKEIGEDLIARIDRFVGESTSRDDLSVALIRKQ